MRPAHGAATVAVIDDDDAVRHSISNLLQSAGYQCKTYGSAEAFLDARASEHPDCAIVDFHLPGLNGIDLQYRLNEMDHSIPIIVVSAYEDRVRGRALQQGAVAVLGKPFDGGALLVAVRSALERAGHGKKP